MRRNAWLKGIGVSGGLAQGEALLYCPGKLVVPDGTVEDSAAEKLNFLACVDALHKKVSARGEAARAAGETLQAEILDAHLEILEDTDSVIDPILAAIESEKKNAALAVQEVFDGIAAAFEALDDAYLRERGADMRDLKIQLLREVMGVQDAAPVRMDTPAVLVARDLTPSETAGLDSNCVLGILCEDGGRTSHTAVLANEMGIPAVMGCKGALQAAASARFVQLDGSSGYACFDPDEASIAAFAQKAARSARDDCEAYRHARTRTADGREKLLYANVASAEECRSACQNGCEGVGLFRSEFLFYQSGEQLPTEEAQYRVYAEAVRNMQGRPIIIRTFDAGGDKKIPALKLEADENPFLGYRAIRICLRERTLFKTQLRALLRAGREGTLRIMFPMIATAAELREAKEVFHEARGELLRENIPIAEHVELGIMIEVPSAVMMSDLLAREVDFFSIGTNDLTQYTLAADRGNKRVANLYSHYDPAVIRMIAHTIESAHKAGIPCGMCGEAAGDASYVPLLLGLGLDEFSVTSRAIPALRAAMARLREETCRELAARVLRLATREEVASVLTVTGED